MREDGRMSDLYARIQASRQARMVIPVALAILLVVGLAAPVWLGVPALVVVIGFIVWMAANSPDPTSGLARLRMLVIGVLTAVAVGRLLTALLN